MSYKRVLIIHPSREDRQLLKESVIAGSGSIVVKEADSETEGYQLIQQQNFDVILSNTILTNFEKLSAKGTHIIILIPDNSPEQLAKLEQHRLEHYQIFPGDKVQIRNDLSSALWDAISRQNPRFKAPDTKLTFRSRAVEFKGKLLDISNRGVLCQLEVEGNFRQLLQNIEISIVFPEKYGGGRLENLSCYHLATRNIVQQKNKSQIQLVLLFTQLKPVQIQILKTAYQRVLRSKHPLIKWAKDHLEIHFNQTTHYFYITHFLRITLAFAFLVTFTTMIFFLIFEDEADLIWTNGQVYLQSNSDDPWKKIELRGFPVSRHVTVREHEFEEKRQASGQNKPLADNRHAVLKYTPWEVAILSKNSVIKRKSPLWGPLTYQLSGAVHLIFAKNAEKEPFYLKINGLEFYTQASHVFYQDIDSPPVLSIVKGSISLPSEQDLTISINKNHSYSAGQAIISSQCVIQMNPGIIQVVERGSREIAFFKETFLPGFSTSGNIQNIGYSEMTSGKYTLIRNGEKFDVQAPLNPIMVHDQIYLDPKTSLLLKLHSGDRFVVYPHTDLKIDAFPLAARYPLLPLLMEKSKKLWSSTDSSQLTFNGKIRASLYSENRKAPIKLLTNHSTLTIERAEFQAVSTALNTGVSVLSGTVTVSDPLGMHPVKIKRGMRGLVEKGESPYPPGKISDSKLKALLRNPLNMDNALKISTFSQVDIDSMLLTEKSPITLYWNTPLKTAEIQLKNKSYAIKVPKGLPEITLNYEMFDGVESGTHSITISVVDIILRSSEISTKLTLDPNVKISGKNIVFTDKIQFATGQSKIKIESHYLLQNIVNMIKSNPHLGLISIEGHCDSVGSAESNFLLSVARARQVRNYLVEKGISPSRLLYLGFGERRPIARNYNDSGKKTNRRVEFVFRNIPE